MSALDVVVSIDCPCGGYITATNPDASTHNLISLFIDLHREHRTQGEPVGVDVQAITVNGALTPEQVAEDIARFQGQA